MPDGSSEPMKHLLVDAANVKLGVPTCPLGEADAHIKAMQDTAQEWIDRRNDGEAKTLRRVFPDGSLDLCKNWILDQQASFF